RARDTGGAVVAALRLGSKTENREGVLKILKAGQREDGGFSKAGADSSDLETAYRVTRAFVILQDRPVDVPSLRGFVAKCRNEDGGYGAPPGQPSSAGSTYYAAIILNWLAEK